MYSKTIHGFIRSFTPISLMGVQVAKSSQIVFSFLTSPCQHHNHPILLSAIATMFAEQIRAQYAMQIGAFYVFNGIHSFNTIHSHDVTPQERMTGTTHFYSKAAALLKTHLYSAAPKDHHLLNCKFHIPIVNDIFMPHSGIQVPPLCAQSYGAMSAVGASMLNLKFQPILQFSLILLKNVKNNSRFYFNA